MTPQGYAILDERTRLMKARKIETMLGGDISGLDLLDLGAGSGKLATYFELRGARVIAADRDAGNYTSTVPLALIESDSLPFPNASFDVVVFNHVIEHVGDRTEQRAILSEIRRILRPGGRLYLAVPNKWALIEPHFRLPLLGALPRHVANIAVRCLRDASEYDCYPLARGELMTLLRSFFPIVKDVSQDAVSWVITEELTGLRQFVLSRFPRGFFRTLRLLHPTFIMVCQTADE